MLRPLTPLTYALAAIVGLSPFLQAFSSAAIAAGQQGQLTRQSYENCQTQDEDTFRKAIENITTNAFEYGTANLDYDAAVGDAWRKVRLGKTIDVQVDAAVTEVRSETSWGNLIRSLADKERAKELATAVAERVYRSDSVKDGIEQLAVYVSKDVGRQVEIAASDAARPALDCLRAFLGPRYGQTITVAVASEARREFAVDSNRNSVDVSSGDVLMQSTGGLTGAAILLVRRQLANMASRIGARLVGSVLSRLVSVVAGGIGVVLIAKDLWELRNGVLPIIATEMKSEGIKEQVRGEIAKSLRTELQDQVRRVAKDSSDRIITIWREFKSAHNAALDLADRNAEFKSFLDNVRPQHLPQLDEVVSLLRSSEGEAGIVKRLTNGSLEHAVKQLPASGMTIARETQRIDDAIKWHALAGETLDTVVSNGLHRNTPPETLTRASLDRILSVGEPVAMSRLAGLSQETRAVLLNLERSDLKKLSTRLTKEELQTLAAYLNGLDDGPRKRVLRSIADTPASMSALSSDRVRRAIVSSADQTAAVAMMLRTDKGFNPAEASKDAALVWNGQVSPLLLWEKHPILVVAILALLLIVALMLRRIFAPRSKPAPIEDDANGNDEPSPTPPISGTITPNS